MAELPETMKAIVNCRRGDSLTYGVQEMPVPTVKDPLDVIVKMEAAPINPSDVPSIGQIARFAGGKAENIEAGDSPNTVKTTLPEAAKDSFKDRIMVKTGNEGCGVVVAAGTDAAAQALLGKRVSFANGQCYAQYSKLNLSAPMFAELPAGITPLEGCSTFVNPLTAIAFMETMRLEGHKALVHTAAGSQLGRMLIKLCKQQGVPLVNIVRKEEVAKELKEFGAEYVLISSAETFNDDLLKALIATGATLGFDAIGGGEMAGVILKSMEMALRQTDGVPVHPAYGPMVHRQVYRYGMLAVAETGIPASIGVGDWGYSGWVMPVFFHNHPELLKPSIAKAVAGLKDTFSSAFGKHLTLEDCASSPEQYMASLVPATNLKYVIRPNGETMRASMLVDFAGTHADFKPENIAVQVVPIRQPGNDEVQIKVSASSVNPVDWKVASGMFPRPFNKSVALGFDCAGVVTAVGSGTTRVKVGEEVWADVITNAPEGMTLGAFAEYVVTKESAVSLKPKNLSQQEAAVIPLVGLTAVQGLQLAGDESKSVLILGGSGGVGICAIQIAKAMGKTVYTTCSSRNLEFVKGFGADEIIDYTVADWGEVLKDKKIDAVFDTVGDKDVVNRSVGVLKDGGKFLTIASSVPEDPLPRGITGKFFLTNSNTVADLDFLKDLCEAEKLKVPLDKTFTLDEIPMAFIHSMAGKVSGKVSIKIS